MSGGTAIGRAVSGFIRPRVDIAGRLGDALVSLDRIEVSKRIGANNLRASAARQISVVDRAIRRESALGGLLDRDALRGVPSALDSATSYEVQNVSAGPQTAAEVTARARETVARQLEVARRYPSSIALLAPVDRGVLARHVGGTMAVAGVVAVGLATGTVPATSHH